MLSYKYCVVPKCKNTTVTAPEKLFFRVPSDDKIRKKWCHVMRRDPLSVKTSKYCCEDHFDMPNDMVNYMEYHIMGKVSQVRMKAGCVPSKFECQEGRTEQCSGAGRRYVRKKQRRKVLLESLNEAKERDERCAEGPSLRDVADTNSDAKPLAPVAVFCEPAPVEVFCEPAPVKRERQLFCGGCLSVDRALTPLDNLLELYCGLLGDWEAPQLPDLLCWECKALLRRLGQFKRNVAAVQDFLQTYHFDQDTALPPSLSRLAARGATVSVCVGAKPDERVTEAVKSEPPSPEQVFADEVCVKNEVEEEQTTTWQDNDNIAENIWWSPETAGREVTFGIKESGETDATDDEKEVTVDIEENSGCVPTTDVEGTTGSLPTADVEGTTERIKRRKPATHNYVYISKAANYGLDRFFTKVPIDDAEMAALLQRDREDDMFLQHPHRCVRCVRGFSRRSALLTHERKCHSQSPSSYECDICSCRIATKSRLRVHMRAHYLARECKACGHRCASHGATLRHARRHQSAVQCRACRACFPDRRSFRHHYESIHRHFECDHCGKICHSRRVIIKHLARHGPPTCSACGLQCRSRGALTRHRALRHAPPPPERAFCVECDKQFATVANYRQHLAAKRHSVSEARHACPACDKTYARATYMRAHYNFVHLAQPKYKCAQCDLRFITSSVYRQHVRRVHQPDYKPPRDKICSVCGRGFVTNWHLENHRRTHTGERPFACALCGARFGAEVAMRAHVNYVHLKRKRKPTRRLRH